MKQMSYLAAIGGLANVVEAMQACGDESGHKPIGGIVVGRDNCKDKNRVAMPIRDRNAACECGSGKKRKKCCKGKS